MTGPIDPLLGAGSPRPATPGVTPSTARPVGPSSAPGAAAPDATDLNEVYARDRSRLVRLAAVITLDHVLAEEVVQEGFSQLQRRAGTISDPSEELTRSVVQVGIDAVLQHRRGRLRRMVRIRARREFVAARRPVPVQPTGLTPELAATWAEITGLPPRRRALVGLRWAMGLPADALADSVVWPSTMVATAEASTERRLRRALDLSGEALEQRLRSTFAAVLPHLAQEEPITTPRGGIRRAAPAPWSPGTTMPAGARVRVWSSIERRPSRARAFAVAGGIGLLAVAAVTWYSLATGGDEDGPSVSAPVDEVHAPAWYRAIAPLLPPGFDHVALVGVDSTAVTYVAIDLARGTSLDISIARRDAPATPGAEVEVRCGVLGRTDPTAAAGPCTFAEAAPVVVDPAASAGSAVATTPPTVVQALDPAAVAATISAGFDLTAVQSDINADIEATFGAPSPLRTSISKIDTVVARVLTEQVEVGRSSTFDGVVEVLEYARAAGREPISTVTVVHGVYPPPSDRTGGVLAESDAFLAGWVLGADGRAFRVTTAASARDDVPALEELLVDLTQVAVTEVATSEVATSEVPTSDVPGSGVPGTGGAGGSTVATSTTAG